MTTDQGCALACMGALGQVTDRQPKPYLTPECVRLFEKSVRLGRMRTPWKGEIVLRKSSEYILRFHILFDIILIIRI